ncbi:MAG TPA: hypothetical protein VJT82_10330 [Pyrinomonadaceae bacterium]|nr:hypothetical protein [Pyrinomonadaceae bacterium]
MRKLAKLVLPLIFVCACCFHPSESRAQDSIVIKGGRITSRAYTLGDYLYSLSAPNFAANGYWDGGAVVRIECDPCFVGSRLKSTSTFYGGSDFTHTPVFINGVLYTNVGAEWHYKFYTEPVVIPNVTHDVVIKTPFLFNGTYTGRERRFTTQGTPYYAPFITLKLAGRGIATYRFQFHGFLPGGRPYFTYQDVAYDFTPAGVGNKTGTSSPRTVSGANGVGGAPTAK